MITKSALQHSPQSADCYAYDSETLHLRVRCAKNEVDKVTLWIGEPYDWEIGGLDGGNLGGANAYNWTGGEEVNMELEGVTQHHETWFASFVPPKRRSRYCFLLRSKDGSEKILFGERRVVDISNPDTEQEEKSELFNLFCFPYLHASDVIDTPDWVKKTVWYQIFPDRFANGRPEISPDGVEPWGTEPNNENFMGGDLWGVIDKLDYLQDLGVNGLYFCPIFTALANHRYDTTDYFNVDPTLGGNEAFRSLVKEAHKRGMRVMLDAVFNHIGDQHPIWLDVVEKGEDSKYADWFCINQFPVYPDTPRESWDKWNLNYETFGTVYSMIKFNTANNECREYLLEIARHWVEDYEIDAWRLDVANEVDHEFWRDFRRTVRSANPDCYILAEIWHDGMPWLRGNQFDAIMNYPLTEAITDFFAENKTDKEEFMRAVDKSYVAYPQNINEVTFNLLESHDTSRLLFLCGEDVNKAKLAYLFMLTQVGAPCIYYGGEVGLSGGRVGISEANRRCMPWDEEDQDSDLRSFIRSLIDLRSSRPDFCKSKIRWLEIDDKDCIAYERGRTKILINNSCIQKDVVFEGQSVKLAPYGYIIDTGDENNSRNQTTELARVAMT